MMPKLLATPTVAQRQRPPIKPKTRCEGGFFFGSKARKKAAQLHKTSNALFAKYRLRRLAVTLPPLVFL